MKSHVNVFEAIIKQGHDEDFRPEKTEPCRVSPGSLSKIEVLRRRVEQGQELWHDDDNKYADNQTVRHGAGGK